jgi:hypothetical protein
MELDAAMREDLGALTDIKNDFTLDLHIHIKQVAGFQIRIAELTGPLGSVEEELGSKAAFPHLQRLHRLPFAYATTVVEVVRRKEYGALLAGLAAQLTEGLGGKLEEERHRRRELKEALSQLPWTVAALEGDVPVLDVRCGRNELLEGLAVGRQEVTSECRVWPG